MLTDYLTLGLSHDATDKEIRKQYLALVRRNPPEKRPKRFQEITTAYERIKDESARLQTVLFGPIGITDAEQAITGLIRAASPGKRRVGLKPLMDAVSQASGKLE